jgi:hypothetical protein
MKPQKRRPRPDLGCSAIGGKEDKELDHKDDPYRDWYALY